MEKNWSYFFPFPQNHNPMTESKSIQGSRAGDTSETSMQKEIQVMEL